MRLFVALVASFLSFSTLAAGSTGPRKIQNIGCHNTDSVCYITIEGAPVGSSNCQGNSIRWDSGTVFGKNHLALFMAAFYQGKQVDLYIPDNCFSLQPNYPTFLYSTM
jgi:hypothetical protein